MNFKEDFNKIKFKCKRCKRCCENSQIRLSPYDILRLCQSLNISTPEFHKKYTYFIHDKENQNLLTCMLQTSPSCSFLGEDGCRVYKDRPFGCRLYPLATQPLFDGKQLEIKFYLLENCPGSDTNHKLSVGEYKENQGLDSKEIYEPWAKFKVLAINSNLPQTQEYYTKFLSICYDFDNTLFKETLKQLNLNWPENTQEKYELIIKLANKLLLKPFE